MGNSCVATGEMHQSKLEAIGGLLDTFFRGSAAITGWQLLIHASNKIKICHCRFVLRQYVGIILFSTIKGSRKVLSAF